MKAFLMLTGALALAATAASAQTVLPSGGVAPTSTTTPAGTTLTPGTVPGSQPLATPNMRDAGSPRASRRREKVPGMSRQDRKELRKLGKVRAMPDENGEIKKQ